MYLRKIFSLFAFVFATTLLNTIGAQVTIGSLESPAQGALLQLKDDGIYTNGQNASKGLGMPRVILVSNTSLSPTVDTDTEDADENIRAIYTGLTVYNIGEENVVSIETQLCKGLHVWNGQKWIPWRAYPKPYFNIIKCSPGPDFTIDCGTISVIGDYNYNATLNGNTNYVQVSITSPASEVGKKIVLKGYSEGSTDINFSTEEGLTLTGGTQIVTLKGSGTIQSYNLKDFILVSNSSNTTNTNCPFQVRVILPKLRIVGVGANYYQPASQIDLSRSYQLMSNPLAFGSSPTAVVQTMGFTFESYQDITDAEWNAMFASKPDIVIRTYDNIMSNNVSDAIKTYLEAGGVFIDLNDNIHASNASVRALYGVMATSNTVGGVSSVDPTIGKRLIENVDDEIVKGPFTTALPNGSLAGLAWYEDASYTMAVKSVPADQIIVYSYSTYGTALGLPVAFKDKKLNYFYIGDGGFLSGASPADGNAWPFQLDASNMPTAARGYQYNSYLFANIMAWALRQATTNGVNFINGVPK